jgi:hypothetical protein
LTKVCTKSQNFALVRYLVPVILIEHRTVLEWSFERAEAFASIAVSWRKNLWSMTSIRFQCTVSY